MRTRKFVLKLGAAALICASLAPVADPAFAKEYWLRAGTTSVTLPGAAGPIVMWGFADCSPGPLSSTCGTVEVPGRALYVPPGDSTLTVHLLNSLTVPTSLVINGLIKPMSPVWDDGSTGPRGNNLTKRVRSFDAETGPNATRDYTWNNVAPGTYLYQSGTQPQVQVQMGLYGAVTKNVIDAVAATATDPAVPGQAYAGAGYTFNNETTLLYSEIDPELHAAVASGTYGACPAANPDCGNVTSTINYAPKYFLINGQPYQFGASVIEPVGSPGITRLRFLNAGLATHVPMIKGLHWDVIAEDGKTYPYRRAQYTAMVPAAKTLDVLLSPEIGEIYPIIDRRLSLSNNGLADGGMLAFMRFGSLASMESGGGQGGNAAPVVTNKSYDSVKGVTLNIAAPGVLLNATDADSPVVKAVAASGGTTAGGTYTLNANGSFTYVPLAGYSGPTDTFTYRGTDGKALSVPATVTINLTTPTAPALSLLDTFDRANATSLGGNWTQQTPTAPQFPDLGIASNTAIANSTTLGGLAIWGPTTFGTSQGASFTPGGTPNGNAYLVLKATGGTPPGPPANYVRVGCEAGQIVVSTMSGGSNISAYVKQASLGACGSPLSAVVDAKGLVTVFKGGAFAGGVQLPDVAVWKGVGKIGIQLTTVGATGNDFSGGNVVAP
jgi:FtsP/CotA-like multicopper oxidase with cupredoxin domain